MFLLQEYPDQNAKSWGQETLDSSKDKKGVKFPVYLQAVLNINQKEWNRVCWGHSALFLGVAWTAQAIAITGTWLAKLGSGHDTKPRSLGKASTFSQKSLPGGPVI